MTNQRLPVIHIGMPKTATKTLQWRLFAEHSEVFYLGRFDGSVFRGKYREFGACRDEQVFQIMDQIAYRRIRNPDIDSCRSAMQAYLEENNSDGLVPVWSWESYCTDGSKNRLRRAKNLKDLFGEARILVSIRHPVKLLESAFLQQLRRDNIGARYRRGKGAFFCSIDEWIEKNAENDIDNHLDYPQTIRMYVDQFGVDNVCVMPFEKLLADSDGFFKDICQFMGIGHEEALRLVSKQEDNTRWSSIQLQRLEQIKGSFFDSLRFRFAKKPERKKMLDLSRRGVPSVDAEKARVRMSTDKQRQVIERTRTGNEWLDSTFDLGLGEHGYYKV